MRYPVNYIGVAQGYHNGKAIDLGWHSSHGGKNQPIYAVADGVVSEVKQYPNGGLSVSIKHNDKLFSYYGHLKDKSVVVKVGDKVKLGQKIALMGRTGKASGEHVHFGLATTMAKNINGKSDLDPFELLELYPDQIVGATTDKKYKIKRYVEKPVNKYTTGTYKVTADALNVRTGAGTNFDIVKFGKMTANAQSQIKKLNKNKAADYYVKGVVFTASEVKGTWGKTPSGWVSLNFCEKI